MHLTSIAAIGIAAIGLTMTQVVFSAQHAEPVEMNEARDREAILEHIHGIFRAFLRQDRDALRATHTPDWTGFQGPSTRIERGIDAYMVNAEKSLQNLRGIGYELLDTEVQIFGDLALVYYVARYDYRDRDGREGAIPLRSIDIYRREGDGWNQCGSHITPIPANADWGQRREADADGASLRDDSTRNRPQGAPRSLTPAQREELLAAREAVWRAWFAGDQAALGEAVPEEAIAMDLGVAAWADRAEILRRAEAFATTGELVRLEFPETRMQVYGDVAILYTTFAFETSQNGRRKVVSGRGTEIFVRRDGRWLNSGWHLEPDEGSGG